MRKPCATIVAAVLALSPATVTAAAPGKVYIPPLVAMRDMTPAEEGAHRLWNLRAALNVAALQCQFSPFLRTVSIYNNLIAHHSAELEKARATMAGHFKRLDGAKRWQSSFDQYTTRTYSSYSTLDAQLSFCDAAALVGRQALAARKNDLGTIAARYLPDIRASLSPQEDPLTRLVLFWSPVPQLENPCIDKKSRPIKRCFDKK